jgi:hypothetical protein
VSGGDGPGMPRTCNAVRRGAEASLYLGSFQMPAGVYPFSSGLILFIGHRTFTISHRPRSRPFPCQTPVPPLVDLPGQVPHGSETESIR